MGHSKSLIYKIFPVAAKKLANLEKQFPAEPMLFVISPLNSLITDQINSCKVDMKSSKFND